MTHSSDNQFYGLSNNFISLAKNTKFSNKNLSIIVFVYKRSYRIVLSISILNLEFLLHLINVSIE